MSSPCPLPNPLGGPPQVCILLRPNLAFSMVFFSQSTHRIRFSPPPACWFILLHSAHPPPTLCPVCPGSGFHSSALRLFPFQLPHSSPFLVLTDDPCASHSQVSQPLPCPSAPGPVQDGRALPGPPLPLPLHPQPSLLSASAPLAGPLPTPSLLPA